MKNLTLFIIVVFHSAFAISQDLTADEIIKNSEEKYRGKSSKITMTVTIERPKWSREMTLTSWSKGNDYSISVITAPAKDAGSVMLKREKEIYNYVPSIERVIKLPPSMMMQNWMGTDLTNDDLVRETSMVEDYSAKLIGVENIENREAYKIELTPKPNAAVVWTKVIIWIDKKEFLQLKTEFYDEDDFLVNTFIGKDIKEIGGRILTSKMEVIPADKPGNKTIMQYNNIEFDINIEESFFSTQNMKKIR